MGRSDKEEDDEKTKKEETMTELPKENKDFEIVMSRILDLARPEDEDEYVDSRVICTTLDFVYYVGLQLGNSFPRALVAADSLVGIRIEWRKPNNAVILTIPTNKNESPYVFSSFNGQYAVEVASSASLLKHIREFIS